MKPWVAIELVVGILRQKAAQNDKLPNYHLSQKQEGVL